VPEETQKDAVDGKITVEADGVQAQIYCSVFYNCIPGKDETTGQIIVSEGGLAGFSNGSDSEPQNGWG